MMTTVRGVYRQGAVELIEHFEFVEGSRVIVTFLPLQGDLRLEHFGIAKVQADLVRLRLVEIAAEWDRSEPGEIVLGN